MRGFLRTLLFALAGPYVGLIAIGVFIGSYTLLTTGSARDFGFGPALVEPGILIVVYTVGFVPALLVGAVLHWQRFLRRDRLAWPTARRS